MIQLENIHLLFGSQVVFTHFSLHVANGEKVLIRGPSGSGKSTLLHLVLGFQRPDRGTVCIDGEPLRAETIWALRQRMAFVPQDIPAGEEKVEALFETVFGYTANRHLAYRRQAIAERFERLGLAAGKLDQPMKALSGGEKQRVGLILALSLQRDIYLFDEITSALDDALQEQVLAEVEALEATVLLASHQPVWEGRYRTIKLPQHE